MVITASWARIRQLRRRYRVAKANVAFLNISYIGKGSFHLPGSQSEWNGSETLRLGTEQLYAKASCCACFHARGGHKNVFGGMNGIRVNDSSAENKVIIVSAIKGTLLHGKLQQSHQVETWPWLIDTVKM